jgi:hypothetical protein
MPERSASHLAIRVQVAEHVLETAVMAVDEVDLQIERLERDLFAIKAKRPRYTFRVERLRVLLARLEEELDQALEESDCEAPQTQAPNQGNGGQPPATGDS